MPKFVADRMLGRLARRLRMLGYDTLYPRVEDSELVRLARAEERILLTRDTHLSRRKGLNLIFIESERVKEQLKQLMRQLELTSDESLTSRCTICNTELEEMGREEARDYVPEFIYYTHRDFAHCPACHKFYWKGTHWKGIK
ncbi:Mut7-C RNAse domain-containing protein [candidate division NPL-UPA2 bacterium]|nr:Mut7-C RNAse domain-containing protein [candidate division NPL-UPA2 bacterium]